ncbi:hypothetical protein [Blastomonas aquatica]|uniref:Transmembrane protein n=1 Tax=Blastomonas aquatica TaxID=1510276 RepID=A0ABQ1JEE7_9SPHN|nr:hypothetical protein [Blastomonas aquatica]GGB64350.1 hypothetical protein GCM10010833_19300 [Blastomonas aquatica]
MSGVAGGWLAWIFVNGLIMATLCFLISLATRHFLTGATLVLVTMLVTLLLVLVGLGVGMAQSDFRIGVVLPYALLAAAIAGAWLFCMKAQEHSGG